MIPVLAGIAYEYIRWMANHLESSIVKVLIKPNLALQHLTTREPTEEMLEVSITALRPCAPWNRQRKKIFRSSNRHFGEEIE